MLQLIKNLRCAAATQGNDLLEILIAKHTIAMKFLHFSLPPFGSERSVHHHSSDIEHKDASTRSNAQYALHNGGWKGRLTCQFI